MLKKSDFEGYTILSNGDIYSLGGKKMFVEETKGVKSIRLSIKGVRKAYNISRLLYYCFVERFDINNKNLCVSFKDGNKTNISIENLYLTDRMGIGIVRRVKEGVYKTDDIITYGKIDYSIVAKNIMIGGC